MNNISLIASLLVNVLIISTASASSLTHRIRDFEPALIKYAASEFYATQPESKVFNHGVTTYEEFIHQEIVYGDVTSDGIDEAIIPHDSEGRDGYIGLDILGLTADGRGWKLLERRDGGIKLSPKTQNGHLVIKTLVSEDDRPRVWETSIFRWDGRRFIVIHTSRTL